MEKKRPKPALWAVVCWLLIWQLAAIAVDQPVFFASPLAAARSFWTLMQTKRFWISAFNSTVHVFLGIGLATLLGILCAGFAHAKRQIRELLAPLMLAIKSVPVVSYVILALICFSSRRISILITFLVVLPVIYANLLSGLDELDPSLEEMALLYRMRRRDRSRYITLPQVFPAFVTGFSLSCGMAWKAGAAAEVIGASTGTIGERIGQTKLYLETPELFAWTALIILLSVGTEKLGLFLLKKGFILSQKVRLPRGAAAGQKKDFLLVAVEAEGIGKSFGDNCVLKEVNLSMKPGEHLCLMGPSGGGKTTLLRILSGLEQPDAGKVSSPRHRQTRLCFQDDRLIPHLDAIANVGLANPGVSRGRILSLLKEAGLEEHLSTPAGKLSGGEKRRVTLIRALCSNAPVLLLDEPFTGLDEERREQMLELAKRECQGRTLLIATHSKKEAMALADRVLYF